LDLATKTVLHTLVHTIVSRTDPGTAKAIVESLFVAGEDLRNENFHAEARAVESVAEAALVAQDNRSA
jgi:hypothetical protein